MLKQAAYKQQSVQTASPGELTLMLYNGCLKQLRIAENAIKDNHFQQKNEALTKAEAIIKELMITLKTDTEVGENMMRMYEYIHYQLIEANIKSDLMALQEAQATSLNLEIRGKKLLNWIVRIVLGALHRNDS
ncbi:flagellar biosynthesis protein FliS [Bacillus sp. JCM 19047]|nr:flagellar biosynthesis protein FliS [Bacillus sp. JCM 19047]